MKDKTLENQNDPSSETTKSDRGGVRWQQSSKRLPPWFFYPWVLALGWCGPKVDAATVTSVITPTPASIRFDSPDFSFQIRGTSTSSTIASDPMLRKIRAEFLKDASELPANKVLSAQNSNKQSCTLGWSRIRFIGDSTEEFRLCQADPAQAAVIKKLETMVSHYDRERSSLWGDTSAPKVR